MQSWFIARSRIQGLGVFARVPVATGSVLGLAHWRDGRSWQVTALGRYHNHSVTPNARSVLVGSQRYLIAAKDLEPGEEIVVDYRLQPEFEQPKSAWRS